MAIMVNAGGDADVKVKVEKLSVNDPINESYEMDYHLVVPIGGNNLYVDNYNMKKLFVYNSNHYGQNNDSKLFVGLINENGEFEKIHSQTGEGVETYKISTYYSAPRCFEPITDYYVLLSDSNQQGTLYSVIRKNGEYWEEVTPSTVINKTMGNQFYLIGFVDNALYYLAEYIVSSPTAMIQICKMTYDTSTNTLVNNDAIGTITITGTQPLKYAVNWGKHIMGQLTNGVKFNIDHENNTVKWKVNATAENPYILTWQNGIKIKNKIYYYFAQNGVMRYSEVAPTTYREDEDLGTIPVLPTKSNIINAINYKLGQIVAVSGTASKNYISENKYAIIPYVTNSSQNQRGNGIEEIYIYEDGFVNKLQEVVDTGTT